MILDEVITGFRLSLTGAAGYYNLTPDLVTYGKIIGGGLPVGAFGGRTDIMNLLSPDGPVYQAGTLSGNPLAMVAGLTTLQKLADGTVYTNLERKMAGFVRFLNERLHQDQYQIVSIGSIFWLVCQKDIPRAPHDIGRPAVARFNRSYHSLLERGVYFPPSAHEVCFISIVHTGDMLKQAADTIVEVLTAEV